MPFPVSPNPGDSYTDAYGTVWIYAGSVNGWYRQEVIPGNETTYTGGGSGSATATGAAGEIQFTDGTNLAASPNLLWDDANDELEVTGDLKLLDGGNHTTTLQTITPTQNNTISLPNATGTVALVAGSSGQPVYNNAGAYAGLSTATIGATGNITLSLNGAVSATGNNGVPVAVTGTWVTTGGSTTTTKPQVLIEPTGAISNTWSTSGTGLGVNAASGFAGNLLDLQVNGTSRFTALQNGELRITADPASAANYSKIRLTHGNGNFGEITSGSGGEIYVQGVYARSVFGIRVGNTNTYGWSSGSAVQAADTALARDQAGVVAITNGSTGTGYLKQTPVAVSALPAAATVGAGTRGFVSDSTVAASGNFGATVAGGGSNKVPVFSDGTNWLIG